VAETVNLTTPITKPPTNAIQLTRLTIDVVAGSIYIEWKGDDGQAFSAAYPTLAPAGSSQPTGTALITSLNTANLSTVSLVKRIYQRLMTDGYIAGTITGTPQ
jgi:hypothetical protein